MRLTKKNKILLYHIYFWIAYAALGVLLKFSRIPNYTTNIWENLFADILILNIPYVYGFYVSWLIYSKFLDLKKLINLIISLIIAFITYTVIWYIVDYWILPLMGENYIPPTEFNFWRFIATILFLFIECNLIAFGFQYFKQTLNQEKLLRMLQNEKLEIEYAFLRAQINPHFLNNTLNFFYAKSLPLSEELSSGIMTLSQIMRYSLQIDQNNQLMQLSQEIEHVQNIININQLRLKNRLYIDIKIEGEIQNFSIAPLTLVTILENILKNGDYTNFDSRASIELKINQKKDLELQAYYNKKNGLTKLSNGADIENLIKRLNSYYGKRFKLNIIDQDDFYELNLILPNIPLTLENDK